LYEKKLPVATGDISKIDILSSVLQASSWWLGLLGARPRAEVTIGILSIKDIRWVIISRK
jgi:hypothetical protein